MSKRLRQRSLPPPAPPPKHEFSLPRPSAYTSVGKAAPAPRVVASDYYKKYIKSVYEREPMFKVGYSSCRNVVIYGRSDSVPSPFKGVGNHPKMTSKLLLALI